ncbi:hypothetical protein G6F55_001753 [Rhizopus delemar]|uniref:Protein PNS1 n=2 Tax=Rhizopus TaxID=4842 RepID=A0A9P7CSV5_9FUNG|nr:hypothetical protein G6F55_001753 [Rhizopus delemar]KAG1554272.1 hypothetical protein G6F51_000072 [Rhizopus arrhizus]KAG1528333.1 hypothetical protein G6F52_000739 [Rhizopus delemar]KAG1556582.1 hypothetical protein G6F49_006151 [Rhizopus delemar]KAG1573283.1 hypothetical protein G6F50_002986 [Rhizopus delemar]
MDQSIQFAKETISNIRNSIAYGKRSGYYAQMDAESENEEDDHSLFYSIHQNNNQDSIPLTLSNTYSDRSQLVFSQDFEEENFRPSSIYLDQPELLSSSELVPPLPINPNSLSESLLPTTPTSHSVEGYVKESIFKVIKDSAGMLATIIGTSLIVATLWSLVLHYFTKTLVWVESFQSTFVYKGNQESNFKDTMLTWLSILPLILNLIYIKVVYDNKHRINKTVTVIELACETIRSNPIIFIVPVLLLMTFIIFTIIWIILFNRLWLIGHLSDPPTLSKTIWIVNSYVYYLAAFYIFFYMWTSAVLVYLEKFTLSAMISQWYFHRNSTSSTSVWRFAMIRGMSTSFGTIALSGFLMAIIQFLQLIIRLLKKYSKKSRPFATFVELVLSYIEPFINIVNHYTVALAGITSESFFSAANSSTKIFKRNLLSGIFGDLLTQIILQIGNSVIALASGLAAYVYATHQLHSPHGLIVGLIGTLTSCYISQFYSYTLMSIIDATFLCYAIDLDIGTVHLSAAHTAFTGYD